MGCYHFGNVTICAPKPTMVTMSYLYCTTEETHRLMLSTSYEWYGGDLVCLGCGERWNEDGRAPRPFMRGWRLDSIKQALRHLPNIK